jgi:hypothetical protein
MLSSTKLLLLDDEVKLKKLHVDGKTFRTSDNKPFQQLNITAFKLFKNYLSGQDIIPFLNWSSQRGNTLRVFFSIKSWINLDPSFYTLEDVHKFLDLLQSYNLYCEVVIFAAARQTFDNEHEQINFYNRIVPALRLHDNVFLELVNENDVSVNSINTNSFSRPASIICSHGSNGGDSDPVTPPWDYMTFHLGRNSEWPRKAKSAREFQEIYNVPCTNNETNRPDLASYDEEDFSDCGFVSAILCAGVNAHSESLKYAEIPTGDELKCVESLLSAAKQIPAFVPSGLYSRGGFSDFPMYHDDSVALRSFASIIDNKAYVVLVRAAANNPRQAVNGWHIVENNKNFYLLER